MVWNKDGMWLVAPGVNRLRSLVTSSREGNPCFGCLLHYERRWFARTLSLRLTPGSSLPAWLLLLPHLCDTSFMINDVFAWLRKAQKLCTEFFMTTTGTVCGMWTRKTGQKKMLVYDGLKFKETHLSPPNIVPDQVFMCACLFLSWHTLSLGLGKACLEALDFPVSGCVSDWGRVCLRLRCVLHERWLTKDYDDYDASYVRDYLHQTEMHLIWETTYTRLRCVLYGRPLT